MLRAFTAAVVAAIAITTTHCACAAPPGMSYTLSIDSSLNERQAGLVADAAAAWEEATGVEIKVSRADCWKLEGEYFICVSGQPKLLFEGGAIGRTYKRASDQDSAITLSNDWADDNDQDYRELAEHEIGHALGLQHEMSDPAMCAPNVMNWQIDHTAELSMADVNQFFELRGMADKYEGPCAAVVVDNDKHGL